MYYYKRYVGQTKGQTAWCLTYLNSVTVYTATCVGCSYFFRFSQVWKTTTQALCLIGLKVNYLCALNFLAHRLSWTSQYQRHNGLTRAFSSFKKTCTQLGLYLSLFCIVFSLFFFSFSFNFQKTYIYVFWTRIVIHSSTILMTMMNYNSLWVLWSF